MNQCPSSQLFELRANWSSSWSVAESRPWFGPPFLLLRPALAKAPAPENQPLDGISYAEFLTDPAHATLDREALYWHFPGYLGAGKDSWRTKPVSVIRAGDWKLIENLEDRKIELYDLKNDLGETNNLASSQPEKSTALLARLNTWRETINAPLPTANKPALGRPVRDGKVKADNTDEND